MHRFGKHRDLADSAHELQRAAGHLQRNASRPDTVEVLPTALAHLEEALERLATAASVAAGAVEEHEAPDARAADPDVLSPAARALRWHLAHLAARLRAAGEACPDTRRWARELTRVPDVEQPRPLSQSQPRVAALGRSQTD
jgi:hypothetical protein